MSATDTLSILRFDENGERLSWKTIQMGSSTQTAPFGLHGQFDLGDEIWTSILIYKDGATLLSIECPSHFSGESSRDRPIFLLYPSTDVARQAGWKV